MNLPKLSVIDVITDAAIDATQNRAVPIPTTIEQQQFVILIIDDSETDRVMYRRYAGAANVAKFTFLEAEDGSSGIELCKQHSPDLILLDYRLPDLDGLEFLQILQETTGAAPPVIMLTGEGNEKVAVEAMKIGVRDYLVKGDVTKESFSQALRRVLSQQALQQLVNRRERQQRLVASVALRINQAKNLDETLSAAAEGARDLLGCDRTVIYRFESDMNGTILAESVLPEWPVTLGTQINDTCFQENGARAYFEGRKSVIPDIHSGHLTPCHIKMLERFGVRANLVVPIVTIRSENNQQKSKEQPKKLWGLMIAHHCRAPRDWQEDELSLLDDLSVQLAIAIRHNEMVSQLKHRAKELAKSNSKLSKAARLLKERNQELDQFAYVASHDLRAPLRAISNLAGWLEEDIAEKIPEENREQLKLMQSRAKRLDDFITGLLDYSRAGRGSLETVDVETRKLLIEVVESLAPPPSFKIVYPENTPKIHTQPLFLQQVLTNLIGNAIKYHNREDGCITVVIEDLGELVEFSIIDDGPGIAAEFHDKIFGVFQTLTSRDNIESTGIGLSIVKKVVENQGGTVTVISALKEGSTFRFTWPKRSA